jgi:hypothetical protein
METIVIGIKKATKGVLDNVKNLKILPLLSVIILNKLVFCSSDTCPSSHLSCLDVFHTVINFKYRK